MEKLTFDTGIREYQINGGGVLRFNPGDPNVYERFFRAAEQIETIERELGSADAGPAEGKEPGERAIALLAQADRQIKELLNGVFGAGNDFDALLEGINLMAVASNGERVVTNLFAALAPVLEQGARECAEHSAAGAIQQAELNRAARRAMKP